MTKQKTKVLLLTLIPFGLGTSFALCFSQGGKDILPAGILVIGLFAAVICSFFAKLHKDFLSSALKAQPAAAVLFAASFVLSFLPYPMITPMLFAVLIFNTVCLCSAFELKKEFVNGKIFAVFFLTGAVLGVFLAIFCNPCRMFVGFALLSLLCRPVERARTVQDAWNDIALPLFVFVCSFALFIATSHIEDFPPLIWESAVMVMIGSLIISSSQSAVRLMLMTAVTIVFGCYVFSAQNPDSVFHLKNGTNIRIEHRI